MKKSGLVPFYLLALAIASAVMVPGFVLPIGDVMGGLFRFIVGHKLYENILSIGWVRDRGESLGASDLRLRGGVLWWAWHPPREIPGILAQGLTPAFLGGQLLFLALCAGLSVVITALWLGTGGSVWPGILVHGMTNYWSKALAPTVNRLAGTDARNVVVLGAAVVVVVWQLKSRTAGRQETASRSTIA